MAKFKQNNVELRDGQKLIFDSAKNKYMSYDGSELFVTTNISGVEPIEGYHLGTKEYIDSEITTATGNSVQYIDDLLDVTSNNPLDYQVLTWSGGQWVPTTQVSFTGGSMGEWEYKGVSGDTDPGNKRFKADDADASLITELYVSDVNRSDVDLGNFLGDFEAGDGLYMQKTNYANQAYLYEIVSVVDNITYHTFTVTFKDYTGIELNDKDKITFVKLVKPLSIITDHGLLTGLEDDDHTQYTLVSGTRAFTGTVGGIDPTADNHLTTKSYVDDEITTLSGSLGAPIFGSEYGYNSSEGESSTTSTTPIEKVSLSKTGLPSGTYHIEYSMEFSVDDDKNADFNAQVQIDDTTTIARFGEALSWKIDDGIWIGQSGFYDSVLSGDVDIDMDYWDTAGVGANIRRARLVLWRVA